MPNPVGSPYFVWWHWKFPWAVKHEDGSVSRFTTRYRAEKYIFQRIYSWRMAD